MIIRGEIFCSVFSSEFHRKYTYTCYNKLIVIMTRKI